MNLSKKTIFPAAVMVLLAGLAAVLYFLQYTKVEIFVRDRNDRPIDRAEIVISRTSRLADVTLRSNESGHAAKYLQLPEIDRIEVSRMGYAPAVLSGHLVTERPVTIVLREWTERKPDNGK